MTRQLKSLNNIDNPIAVEDTKKMHSDNVKNKFMNYSFLIVMIISLTAFNSIYKFPSMWIVSKASDALLIVMGFAFSRKVIIPKPVIWFFIFLAVTFMTSSFVSINVNNAILNALTILEVAVVITAVITFYCTTGDIDFLLVGLIVNGVILALLGNFLLGDDLNYTGSKVQRLTSIVKNSNDLGRQMMFASVCLFYFWARRKLWMRIIIVFLLCVFLYNIFQSGSRTALISFLVIGGTWVILSYRLKLYIKYFVIFLIFVSFCGSYIYDNYLANTTSVQRLLSIEDEADNGGSTGERLLLYEEAAEAFINHPMFGIGLDNFRLYSSDGLYAHSNYMELLADTGIVGFLLFNYIYWITWKNANRIRARNDYLRYEQGFQRTVILLLLLIGFARPLYDNLPSWMFFSLTIIMSEKFRLKFLGEQTQW